MARNKYIIVKSKETQRVVERINCNDKFHNNFQIGYEAGKLVGKYPEDEFMIYMEESKLKY
jgi:hypothetical protein